MIKTTIRLAEDPIGTMADRKLLKLVLTNLVDNAVKSIRVPGGLIEIASSARGDLSCLAVMDNGIGIGPAEQGRIFERFYQVGSAAKESSQAGTGLGLAIVKHATAAMGGRVELDSTVGQGTEVRVLIPETAGRE